MNTTTRADRMAHIEQRRRRVWHLHDAGYTPAEIARLIGDSGDAICHDLTVMYRKQREAARVAQEVAA